MDFRLLGPLETAEQGRPLALGGPKQRALLAILLLQANDVVCSERLIDELWGESPPATTAWRWTGPSRRRSRCRRRSPATRAGRSGDAA